VQAGEHLEYVGKVELAWDPESHQAKVKSAEVIPLDIDHGEDAGLKTMLETARAKVAARLDEPLSTAVVELEAARDTARRGESNLGSFICDVLRASTKSDVAFYNSGGIRASIAKGPIALRDLYRALPFRNTVMTGYMTGSQIKSALQTGVKYRSISGSLLQVSGLRYKVGGNEVREVLWKGRPLPDEVELKVASNSFVFSGGDFLEEFESARKQEDLGVPVEDYVAEFLRSHPRVGENPDGRLSGLE
jgi:2',3'-cyclic-nucleotide 2'-phosphodiesterase (5'-nucleotidase family)